MKFLTWEGVNAWRLSQHGLSHRYPPGALIQAVRQTLGIHAQVASAAEMAIAARVDNISPQDIQSALWQERSLVKTWIMRQTLHLVPSADLPIYTAARRLTDIRWPELFERNGVSPATFDAYMEAAPRILDGHPQTRQQFIQALDEQLKSPELHHFLLNGSWGTAFKPLAWRGELCFGPGSAQNATFVRPSAWIGGWEEPDAEASLQEIIRRYLRAFGPARPRDFQVWWWTSLQAAKKAFNSIADETEEVEVEGWRAVASKEAIPHMQEMEPGGEVYLLPPFDAYTVGIPRGKNLERVIASENRGKVFRQQGWVSGVVLVNGFFSGTWESDVAGGKITLTVNLFSPASKAVIEGIAREAERIGEFVNVPVSLKFMQD